MKGKRGGWKCLSLLLLCFLFLGITKMDARAEEAAEVPQITLTLNTDEEVTTVSGQKLHLSMKNRTLVAEDFTEQSKWTSDDTWENFCNEPGTKNCINGGTIIATLSEKQNSNGMDLGTSLQNIEVKVQVTGGTFEWIGTGDDGFYNLYRPELFEIAHQGYKTGLMGKLTWNNEEYVVNFPVEIKCSDYFSYDSDGSVLLKLGTTTRKKVSGKYKYTYISASTSGKMTKEFVDDTTYVVNLEEWDSKWEGVNSIYPIFAYGATADGMQAATADGIASQKVFYPNTSLVKEESYKFKVKNQEGVEKEFTIIINMPWKLVNMLPASEAVPTLKIEDKNVTPDGGGVFGQYASGTDMEISIALKGDYEEKKLSDVVIREGTTNTGKRIPCTVEENTVRFKMPRESATLWSVATVDADADEHRISTAVEVKDSTEESSGLVQVFNESGSAVSRAYQGAVLTLKAIKNDNYKSMYDWTFDHWEAEDGLIAEADKTKSEVSITMPDKDVSVKAVYVRCGETITVGTTQEQGGKIRFISLNNGMLTISTSEFTDIYKAGELCNIELENPNLEAYEFLGWKDENGEYYNTEINSDGITWKNWAEGYKTPSFTLEVGKPRTFIADFRAKTAGILTLTTNDDKQGTVSAKVGEKAIVSGTTVLYDGQTISLTAEAKKSYRFKEWKVTEPASDSGVTFADETASTTTFVMPAKQALTIQAVFEPDPNYQSEECTLSKVELLTSDGKLVKQADKDNNTFTIQLSPKEMTKDEAAKLTSNAYKLRLTYSDNATAKKDGGYGDNDGADKWSDGIFNPISVGSSGTFIITAQNTNFKQEYTIAIAYDDRPLLTAGAVNRISDTEATVDFTSSSAGSYYYAVVEKGATEPKIDTDGVGVAVKANKAVTISLKSLTAGAKDIYIKVKNDDKADDVKISEPLKITIPDYDPDKTGYTISLSQSPGGTISVDKKLAKEGEIVTVTVTPDAGKKIKPDGLRYSQSGPPYEVVKIDTTTKQFQMPAYNISVSCTFVDADTVTTDGPTIGAFIVNGVSGAINDTTGTITITLPYGTDLTALKPAITLKGAVSVSPASGATVNLSSPVTYTVTAEDGTTKTYTVTAYTEAQPVSDKLWEDMLNHIGGNTSNTGKNTWWQKAKDMKKNNNYPKYW